MKIITTPDPFGGPVLDPAILLWLIINGSFLWHGYSLLRVTLNQCLTELCVSFWWALTYQAMTDEGLWDFMIEGKLFTVTSRQ